MQASIINDYILTHTTKTEQITDYMRGVSIGSEMVDYVILQNPSISVTGGGPSIYSIITEISSNIAIMASPSNLLLYRTFTVNSKHKQMKEI